MEAANQPPTPKVENLGKSQVSNKRKKKKESRTTGLLKRIGLGKKKEPKPLTLEQRYKRELQELHEREVPHTPWWHRLTSMERIVVVALSCAVFVLLVVMALFIYFQITRYSGLCLTAQCMKEAKYLLSNINFSIDPCEDFYRFACGKAELRSVPKGENFINIFKELKNEVIDQIADLLAERENIENDPKSSEVAKTMYGLCIDINKVEDSGHNNMLTHLKSLGGWPVLERSWDDSSFHWTKLISKLREKGFGFQYIFKIGIEFSPENVKNIFKLDFPSFSRLEPIEGQEKLIAYRNYMAEIAQLLQAPPSTAEKDMEEVAKMETRLQKATIEEEKYTTHVVKMGYLKNFFPYIPWYEFFKTLPLVDIPVNEDEDVLVVSIEYLRAVDRIMQQTEKRVHANYLIWRAIDEIIPYLPKRYQLIKSRYGAALGIFPERPNRAYDCAEEVSASLSIAVANLYLRRHSKENLKMKVGLLVKTIKDELSSTVRDITWIDEVTRVNQLDKYVQMGESIAYPDELLDNNKVDAFYQEVKILENGTYLDARLSISRFYTTFDFKRVDAKFNQWEWYQLANVFEIRAEYLDSNIIRVPTGILQGHFYSENRPNYMNYGALGWVVGRELTQAFFDQGNWWHGKSQEEFDKKAECLIDQYSKYTVAAVGQQVDGVRTFKENFADNGGVMLAYTAYQKLISDNPAEQILPGFDDYNANQMFWISAAVVGCTAYGAKPEQFKAVIANDQYSPGEFRVKGSFSNSREFSYDFSCARESPMNPTDKCLVW